MSLRYRLHLMRPRYMKLRVKRAVCYIRGHRYGDIATRLLGVCDRCFFPFDGPDLALDDPGDDPWGGANLVAPEPEDPVPAKTWAMPPPAQVRKAPRRPLEPDYMTGPYGLPAEADES